MGFGVPESRPPRPWQEAARAWTLGLRLHLIGQIGMTVFYCMVLAAGQHNLASEQREDSWAAK